MDSAYFRSLCRSTGSWGSDRAYSRNARNGGLLIPTEFPPRNRRRTAVFKAGVEVEPSSDICHESTHCMEPKILSVGSFLVTDIKND